MSNRDRVSRRHKEITGVLDEELSLNITALCSVLSEQLCLASKGSIDANDEGRYAKLQVGVRMAQACIADLSSQYAKTVWRGEPVV